MELISEYFSWCEGGRKSSIDLGIGFQAVHQRKKKKKRLLELGQIGRMKDHCIKGRRRKRLGADVKIRARIRANGKE